MTSPMLQLFWKFICLGDYCRKWIFERRWKEAEYWCLKEALMRGIASQIITIPTRRTPTKGTGRPENQTISLIIRSLLLRARAKRKFHAYNPWRLSSHMIGGWLNEFGKSVPFLFQRFRAFGSSELVNVCMSFPAPDERIRYIFPLLSLFPLNTFLSFEKIQNRCKRQIIWWAWWWIMLFCWISVLPHFYGEGGGRGFLSFNDLFSKKSNDMCTGLPLFWFSECKNLSKPGGPLHF